MTARTITSVLLTAVLASPVPAPRFDKRIRNENISLHILNRLTFGPRPGDIQAIERTGVKKWVEQQLNPDRIPEDPTLEARLKPLTTLTMSQKELAEQYPSPQLIRMIAERRLPLPSDPERRARIQRLVDRYEQRKKRDAGQPASNEASPNTMTPRPFAGGRRMFASAPVEKRREMLANIAPQQVLAHDLYEQKLYRAVYSNRQLQEVLTDFWFNHFNVFMDKGADRYLVTSYERDAIRPHVLGKFRDLLLATSQHPAMLFYLDNWQSVSPDAGNGRSRRARGLNENYARELLELHSLGVDGGYTQQDVINVARCFTGWTISEPFRNADFTFNSRVHDNDEKTVLGVRISSGGGKEDGLKVIDILARHPATARFISRKLAQRFVADDPPESLIKAMSETFRKSDGDIKAVMRTMLSSREFVSEAAYQAKVKSPFEMVVSALRATGADVTFAFGVATKVGELGQPLYRKQEPTGYSNKGTDWVNSAALLGRMNFALDLVQNKLPGVNVDMTRLGGDPYDVAKRILSYEASPQTRAAIQKGLAEQKEPSVIAGLVLGSPEFQRR